MTTTAVKADARNRAARTFLQGLAADLVAALILLLLPIVTSASGWGDFEWGVLLFLVAKTVVVTVFSYVMRTWLDRRTATLAPPVDERGAGELGTVVLVLAIIVLAVLLVRLL